MNNSAAGELKILYSINKIFSSNLPLKKILEKMFTKLSSEKGYARGALYLVEPESREITIRVALNLSSEEKKKGRYNIGEGVTGKVVKTGKPVTIPVIAKDPDFLDKTGARANHDKEKLSFLCVPIKLDDRVIGAISVDKYLSKKEEFETDINLLKIISQLIARSVKTNNAIELEKQKLLYENIHLKYELKNKFRPDNIIGNSSAMRKVYEDIDMVSKNDVTVLIRGETGTGKELAANAIHYNSIRKDGPYIKLNCATLPENLLESELFGYRKGAFTGAFSDKTGKFEAANNGTIFLDEIGEIPPSIQVKLLRVLQEKEFEKLGDTSSIKINVRIIAATNKNLEEAIRSGDFREDLYYRLNMMQIYLPPLRERKSDIIDLADFFLQKYSATYNKNIKRISTPAIDMMHTYHWPGNVRELENCIERAVLTSKDNVIHGYHLPPSLQTAQATDTVISETLPAVIERIEKEMIIEALKITRGNKKAASLKLGITERQINYKASIYKISYKKYRS